MGQLSNDRFCCYGDACDGGDADFVIYLFPVTAVTFFEKAGAVSINEFSVFQKIPLYNNEVEEKKYSRILKNLKKLLDSRHVFKFCAHCFQTFGYSAIA